MHTRSHLIALTCSLKWTGWAYEALSLITTHTLASKGENPIGTFNSFVLMALLKEHLYVWSWSLVHYVTLFLNDCSAEVDVMLRLTFTYWPQLSEGYGKTLICYSK